MGGFLANITITFLLAFSTQAQDSTFQQKQILYEHVNLSSVNSSISGICGRQLQTPLEVKISDANGNPIPGIQVAFLIIARTALDWDQEPS